MGHIKRRELMGFSMKDQLQLQDLPVELVENKPYLVNGTKGNNYTFVVSQSLLSIAANTMRGVRLLAEIDPKNNYLQWRLYTRPVGTDIPEHDLYAGLFFDSAMKYFLHQNQHIAGIYENWNAGTNQTQYRAAYRKALKDGTDTALAPFATWNGNKDREHGFNRVEALGPTGLDVMSYIFLFLRG